MTVSSLPISTSIDRKNQLFLKQPSAISTNDRLNLTLSSPTLIGSNKPSPSQRQFSPVWLQSTKKNTKSKIHLEQCLGYFHRKSTRLSVRFFNFLVPSVLNLEQKRPRPSTCRATKKIWPWTWKSATKFAVSKFRPKMRCGPWRSELRIGTPMFSCWRLKYRFYTFQFEPLSYPCCFEAGRCLR